MKKRVRKMYKPKKRKARRVTKHFAAPGEQVPAFTDKELLELKQYYFIQLGQHLLFPEFEQGCPECGSLNFHRRFCSSHPLN